jgi:hypothetical protein
LYRFFDAAGKVDGNHGAALPGFAITCSDRGADESEKGMAAEARIETSQQPRFDIDGLRELAGEKAFARGEVYHAEGQVTLLSIEPERVLARVVGTETYRTELTGTGADIGGQCSCRAFSDWGFCKHMVAVALAANDAAGDPQGAGALARIRTYLREKDVDALVEMIVAMAERDLALFSRLDTAAAMAHADDGTLAARLREAIDTATETRGYIGYRGAAGWATEVEAALDAVAELAQTPRAALALDLAERAIDGIADAIEEIDDSDGECHALLERASEIHRAAASVARPDPVALARDLFERETTDDYGTFAGAAGLYAEVLGEEGLAEYRRLAAAEWEKLRGRAARPEVGAARGRTSPRDGPEQRGGGAALACLREGAQPRSLRPAARAWWRDGARARGRAARGAPGQGVADALAFGRSSRRHPHRGEDVRRRLGGRPPASRLAAQTGRACRGDRSDASARGTRHLCRTGRGARRRQRRHDRLRAGG